MSSASGRIAAAVGMSIALSSCGMFAGDSYDSELVAASQAYPSAAQGNGPAADYPVVVGAPYFIGGKEFSPIDTMNYDEVGFVDVDYSAGAGITGMHHTLPLPSYAEVTSLETGQTILVRMERRGPMASTQLVALSQGALAQLGANAGDPVRVRRVNPPEAERFMLRTGQSAPLRMETPLSLAKVLKRKLPEEGAAPLLAKPAMTRPSQPVVATTTNYRTPALPPVSTSAPPVKVAGSGAGGQPAAPRYGRNNPAPTRATAPALPPIGRSAPARPARSAGDFDEAFRDTPAPRATPRAAPAPTRASTANVPRGGFVVQAIALSSASKADAVARKVSGQVTQSGSIYRVRTGPFSSRAQAQASLAKVRAAGYRDARIFTGG